jgi:hypothetical protein
MRTSTPTRTLRPNRSWRLRLRVAALSGLTLLLLTPLTVAPAALASESSAFAAVIVEDFCQPGVLCGTAATADGRATVSTVINSFVPAPNGCFLDTHTSTLTFGDASTLAVTINGTLCPTNNLPNFTLQGSYSAAGGTGRFTTATGSGSVRGFRQNGPIHEVLTGTLTTP